MAVLEYFTLTGNMAALIADSGDDGLPDSVDVTGFVDVFPRIAKGKTLWAPTLVPPRGVILPPTRGQLVAGVLRPLVGINEVQTVTITGGPTSGTFTLTFAGQTTAALQFNATAQQVQTALRALSTIGSGNVNVAGSAGGPYSVTFVGDLSSLNVAAMTATASLSGGSTPGVTVSTPTTGDPGTGLKLLACTAAVPLDSLRYDLLFSDIEYNGHNVDVGAFAFQAPTTGGGTIDLASVTRIEPLAGLQALS